MTLISHLTSLIGWNTLRPDLPLSRLSGPEPLEVSHSVDVVWSHSAWLGYRCNSFTSLFVLHSRCFTPGGSDHLRIMILIWHYTRHYHYPFHSTMVILTFIHINYLVILTYFISFFSWPCWFSMPFYTVSNWYHDYIHSLTDIIDDIHMEGGPGVKLSWYIPCLLMTLTFILIIFIGGDYHSTYHICWYSFLIKRDTSHSDLGPFDSPVSDRWKYDIPLTQCSILSVVIDLTFYTASHSVHFITFRCILLILEWENSWTHSTTGGISWLMTVVTFIFSTKAFWCHYSFLNAVLIPF